MQVLDKLRSVTSQGGPLELLKQEGDSFVPEELIKDASHVKIGDDNYDLNQTTNFYNDDTPQTLRAVVFWWLHDKSSIVDYKNACLESDIADFKFLVKTELSSWLSGKSDTCTFIKTDSDSGEGKFNGESSENATGLSQAGSAKKRKNEDPQLERIAKFERELIDHNAALRGSKNIDFGYLITDAKRYIALLKRSKVQKQKVNGTQSTGPKKQPIIIVSPATTALLSLTNIKEFLEEGKFVEPSLSTTKKPSSGLVTIHHESDRLLPVAHQFMVVDNVDMFTKPEYWDRVVAIFTTGQAWQFTNYKYSKPEILFQRYAGYYVCYQGEIAPRQIKEWNINEIRVDRGDKRFRDKMIVRDFWIDMEKILVAKGYGK